MSLERKDIRAKVDADVHESLRAICTARGIEIADFVEALVVPEVRRLIHEANLIVASLPRSGKNGPHRE